MKDVVFLTVPRTVSGAKEEELRSLVADVDSYVFKNLDEVFGFVKGRTYGKGELYSAEDLSSLINNNSVFISSVFVFALRYECEED